MCVCVYRGLCKSRQAVKIPPFYGLLSVYMYICILGDKSLEY